MPADGPTGSVGGYPASAQLADRIADLARAVPGVSDLTAGALGEVGTYLPGRRVAGVRITDDQVEIHLATLWGFPILEVTGQVIAAVEPVVQRPVSVMVDDVVRPEDIQDREDTASSPLLSLVPHQENS